MESGGVFARTGIWPRCVAARPLVRPYPPLPVPEFNLSVRAARFPSDVTSSAPPFDARVTSPRFQKRECSIVIAIAIRQRSLNANFPNFIAVKSFRRFSDSHVTRVRVALPRCIDRSCRRATGAKRLFELSSTMLRDRGQRARRGGEKTKRRGVEEGWSSERAAAFAFARLIR